MGIQTCRASKQGQAKIKQAREAKGWRVTEEDNTPLKEASKFLIQQYAAENEWQVNDSRWLRHFEQLFRVEQPKTINEIKTIIAKSKQGSLLERIEQLIEAEEVFAKDISYGSWSRFASQRNLHAIKARAFKAYCHVLGLKWQEIVEPSETEEVEGTEAEIANTPQVLAETGDKTTPLPTSSGASDGGALLLVHEAPPMLTRPYHNLPVRYHTALIGRETEMTQLLELLSRDRLIGPVSVEGLGGAGKTSLVLEAAYLCLEASCGTLSDPIAPTFDAIIFTSAKQQHLIGNHILQRHRRERTLHDIFRAIFRTLKSPGAIPVDFDKQLECIYSSLAHLHTLLIVDNLETLEDREAVLSFLYELPSTVKVVITTRVRAALGVPIYLECLPRDEAQRLIEHQAQEQRVQLKPEQFQAIYQRTSGLPLGIVYAIGQLSVYGISTDALATRLTQADSDLARYCFEDSVQWLRGKPAHQLLMILALFAKSASREAIAACGGALCAIAQIALSDADLFNALAQLYRLRLVMQREERYDMHPLTREYALAELTAHSEFEQQARERWVNWYLKFSEPYGQQDWKQWNEYQDLDQEWENLQAVIDWCIHQNRYEQVRKFWQHIKGYTYVRGYWHELLTWIDWLLQAAEQRQDKTMMTEALGDKGWTLTLMGKPEQLAEVDALFAQVLSLQEGEDLIVPLELSINRAVLSIHQRNFAQAHQLLNQGKDLLKRVQIEEPKRLRQLIRIYYYEAEVWYTTGNYKQAKMLYQKALEQAQVAQWQQVEVYILNWLADIALVGEGNLDEAERLLKTSLPITERRKDKLSITFHKRSWAHLEKMRGNLSHFRHWATEAKEGFESLGMQAEAQEMQSWLDA
jgi:LuxR family glucitol operon transcriptional activator